MSHRLAGQAGRLDAESYPVRFAYRTLYSDMDPNRHLNNGAFGRLFEEGRADLHHRIIDTSAAAKGLTLLLATITIEFLREGRYPGSVEVASAVLRVGGSSYVLAQAAFQDRACVALAECVMVKASQGPGAGPVPLTETERGLLKGLEFRGTLGECSTTTR